MGQVPESAQFSKGVRCPAQRWAVWKEQGQKGPDLPDQQSPQHRSRSPTSGSLERLPLPPQLLH